MGFDKIEIILYEDKRLGAILIDIPTNIWHHKDYVGYDPFDGHILIKLCFKYITPCISMGSHAALCTTGSLSYHT